MGHYNFEIDCIDNPSVTIEPDLPPAYDNENETETNQYFYHPDHLGSSSFITNVYGDAIQHLQYLSFGEPNHLLAVSSRTPLKITYFCEKTFVDERTNDPCNIFL